MKDITNKETQLTTKNAHKHQFPIKRISSLIEIAIKNKLKSLQVGDIIIVPSGESLTPEVKEPGIFAEAEKRKGRPLTPREKQDIQLFGPGGIDTINE